jgi:hypothetical protein
MMTDLEFDVLDELYFVIEFHDLLQSTELDDKTLYNCLKTLKAKGWIKCFKGMDEELPISEIDFDKNYRTYSYLATKKGLLAHNGH